MTTIYEGLLVCSILFNMIKTSQAPSQYEMCKLTRSGNEYMGKISETKSGHACVYWESVNNNVATEYITDHDFPDGNKRGARNFCRNPNNSTDGPWCYTSLVTEEKEKCIVPLCCNEEDCRTTGPGMEYAGKIHKSVYDNECLHWAATYKIGDIDSSLPEGNVMLAGKSCRNPTGSLSGPWCYVLSGETTGEQDKEESWIKQLCNVPTCFSQQFTTVIHNSVTGKKIDNYYTHFTSLSDEKEEITFSLKLWNPEDWRSGEIKIAVSLLATPVNGYEIRNWDIGYEVVIRNIKGGVTPITEEDETWEDQPGLLSGTHWVHLKLSWSNGFISLTAADKNKPYFIHEYKQQENGIISTENAPIKYLSIMGTLAFWNFSQIENYCEEHVTTSTKITRYWPLSTGSLNNKFISFHVRSQGECVLDFRISPPQEYPRVQLRIQDESRRTVIILYKTSKESQVLSSAILGSSLSYWKWEEFSISISGYRFNMLATTKKGSDTVIDVNNQIFQATKWYGIASTSTSHWSFFCKPIQHEYEAMPPECSVSKLDKEYEGHQWVSESGLPCLPWVANLLNGLENSKFPDGTKAAAFNYCRNPVKNNKGAFCFAVNVTTEISVLQQSCQVRKCKFKDCRIAGTANDFMGQVNTTISGRQCQAWQSNKPHVVEKYVLDDNLYPERSISAASNYCRDPSSSMGGPWCYTLDPEIEKDLCNVPDCHKPSSCTIIVRSVTSKKVFMVPQWRAHGLPIWVKMWNPNISTTLVLNFHPLDKKYKYRIHLGDDENENIKLYYISESGSETMLKQKTHQHFLSSGRWVGIVINLMVNQIGIRYEEKTEPFFVWKRGATEAYPSINAMYFSYEAKSKDYEGSLGLNFPCDVCHTEICNKEVSHFSWYHPMNVWLENASKIVKDVTFHVRGSGLFTVNLYVLPSKFPVGVLNIDDGSFGDLMEIQLVGKKYLIRFAAKNKGSPAIVKDYWSQITLKMANRNGSLLLNGSNFLTWTYPRNPLFYYFSVQCKDTITWVVNCPPPQLDGKPIDGAWSPWSAWQCSASCGGGRGTRLRICNHPEPSIYGKACEGHSKEVGICNENACGEVSITTTNSIRKYLAQNTNNIQVMVENLVEMKCNPELLEILKKESPKSSIHWNKDGMKISEEKNLETLTTDDFKMTIASTNIEDTGVYACVIIKTGEDKEVVDVFALTVKSEDFTKKTRIGKKLILKANSILLNSVYSSLRLTWLHNGNVSKEYEVTDLRLIEEEIINQVKSDDAGEWTCIIHQDRLNLNWTTSWYSVLVRGKANWATYLLEEDLLKGKLGSNEIVIYVAVAVILSIVISGTTAITIFIIRLIRYFNKLAAKQRAATHSINQ